MQWGKGTGLAQRQADLVWQVLSSLAWAGDLNSLSLGFPGTIIILLNRSFRKDPDAGKD